MKFKRRGKGNPISEKERELIISLKKEGLSNTQVALITKRSRGTVSVVNNGGYVVKNEGELFSWRNFNLY